MDETTTLHGLIAPETVHHAGVAKVSPGMLVNVSSIRQRRDNIVTVAG
jgi:hypothetical protein